MHLLKEAGKKILLKWSVNIQALDWIMVILENTAVAFLIFC